jgi:hypothetical protein
MTQLYQRISQSQLQLQHFSTPSCANCGSKRHADCSTRSSTPSSSSKDKKKHSTSRSRPTGPTITRMPIKSSSHPQLVVVRPKPSRKGSSGSASSSSKSHSPSNSSPLASPLPLYIAEEAFEIETNGIITGVLGGNMFPPLAGNGRRRKDSYDLAQDDAGRPATWPEQQYGYGYGYGYPYPYVQEHLHQPAPKLPVFVPVAPRKSSSTPTPILTSSSHKKTSPVQSPKYAPSAPNYPPPPPPIPTSTYPPAPTRRRIDKVTPSSYTFASDSTKLGEIPMRNWTTPWDYAEAERLNAEARPVVVEAVGKEDVKEGKKKSGMFRWMRREGGA